MYTLFIDESGEEGGLDRVRQNNGQGACPWFVLGAVLVQNKDHEKIDNFLSKLAEKIGKKNIHFSALKHKQRVYVCQEISKLPIKIFTSISNKKTLENKFPTLKKENLPWKYYNKNAQYLLEKVGKYYESKSIGKNLNRIVFEEKRGVQYDKLKNFISIVSKQPKDAESRFLDFINSNAITAKSKKDERLLELADCVAFSVFQCCEDKEYGIVENRYVREMKGRFFSSEEGSVLDYGVKPIHSLKDLDIPTDSVNFFQNLNSKGL